MRKLKDSKSSLANKTPLSLYLTMSILTSESLSKDVFEQRTSTGSEVFSLTICLEAKKFVLLSFFSLIRTIYLRVSTKPPLNDAKRPLPVDVRRSKTLLLKLPIYRLKTSYIHSCMEYRQKRVL